MKLPLYSVIALLTSSAVTSVAVAQEPLACTGAVTQAIQGSEMFNVVEQVHCTDGVNYVVVFRTASGDAEQASVAVVGVNPYDCQVEYVQYVRGAN